MVLPEKKEEKRGLDVPVQLNLAPWPQLGVYSVMVSSQCHLQHRGTY